MYQAQGKLEILDLLLTMKKELRDFLKRKQQSGVTQLNEKEVKHAVV